MPAPYVSFADLLRVETVRAVEADAPIDDGAAMRAAVAAAGRREERIVERARVLAAALSLDAEIDAVRRTARRLALLLLAAGALVAGSLVAGMLGEGRTLNAAAALGLALAPNLVGLPLWLVAVAFARGGEGLLGAALRQAARLGWLRHRAPQVLVAASRVLDRHYLTAWVWGGANHALWALAYLLALAGMLWAFGVRAYRLGWETTILPPAFFEGLHRTVAWLPAWLGMPVPEAAAAAGQGGTAASAALAWWLVGGVAVYGFGPRLVALALCWARWCHGRHRLSIDLADPYFRRLANRFDAMAPPRVVDVERSPTGGHRVSTAVPAATAAGVAAIAFELPPEVDLPPALRAAAAWSERIEGTLDERDALLRRLADAPPARLLVACHAGSTPDRGTQRFLAAARAPTTAVLLAPPGAKAAAAVPRWRAWLDGSGLADVALLADDAAALAWMEARHG